MEMPIRIIITLFVTVIVALTVITFTQKTISDARMKLHGYNEKEVEQNRIIETKDVTGPQLAALAETCYIENSGKNLQSDICFVVLGHISTTSSEIENSVKTIKKDRININLAGANNAVKIKYNALNDVVEISG